MKTKLYLDTSIPSAYYDTSKPLRQLITQKWFENDAQQYDLYISVLTIEKIDKLGNAAKRENIKTLIFKYQMDILEISNEVKELMEGLASWNFKHIVSINPIRKVHEINQKKNYPLIEIGSLELFGGAKYGNL